MFGLICNKVTLPWNNIFGTSSAGIKKGQNYIFPRVAKNNRAVLPNCARGVTTYRKTFLEVLYII